MATSYNRDAEPRFQRRSFEFGERYSNNGKPVIEQPQLELCESGAF